MTYFFSQKNTNEQNTQTFTETLSQPISQNVTANVSWKASVSSVCRRRSVGSNCAPKGSVNSVRSVREKLPSVREKPPQRVVCVLSHSEGAFSFSQMNTEEQSGQGLQKVLTPHPPSPPHTLPDYRRALTAIQNMPFLHAEHALLGVRKAYSWRMFITSWFLEGYKHGLSRCRTLLLSA